MRTAIVSLLSVALGLVAGFLAAVKIFAIDVDLLAVPYSNKPVEVTEAAVIKQGKVTITIPKGSVIRYKYAPKGMPEYSLDIYADYGVRIKTKDIANRDYFSVQESKKNPF